jgi:hypothetical protein
VGEKFQKTIASSIPKALFVYMPLFAFVTGIFHSRKKWYYFDHGIFTLHFFAFSLLLFSFFSLLQPLDDIHPASFPVEILLLTISLYPLILIIYFFVSHYRLYGQSKIISCIKSFFIVSINLFLSFLVFISVLLSSLYLMK